MIETAQAFGVDIGGSGIKAAPVNLEKGEFAEPRLKILTPEVSTPKAVGEIVRQQLEQRGVGGKFARLHRHVDAGHILIHDASGPDIEVPHFRIAHILSLIHISEPTRH